METDMDTFEEKYRWNAFLNDFFAAVGVLSPDRYGVVYTRRQNRKNRASSGIDNSTNSVGPSASA
jgi:hypothetical protein